MARTANSTLKIAGGLLALALLLAVIGLIVKIVRWFLIIAAVLLALAALAHWAFNRPSEPEPPAEGEYEGE